MRKFSYFLFNPLLSYEFSYWDFSFLPLLNFWYIVRYWFQRNQRVLFGIFWKCEMHGLTYIWIQHNWYFCIIIILLTDTSFGIFITQQDTKNLTYSNPQHEIHLLNTPHALLYTSHYALVHTRFICSKLDLISVTVTFFHFILYLFFFYFFFFTFFFYKN